MKRQRSFNIKKKRRGKLLWLLLILLVVGVVKVEAEFSFRKQVVEKFATVLDARSGGIVKRGNIYDRKNRVLAKNAKVVKVVCNTKEFSSKSIKVLAEILNVESKVLFDHLAEGGRYVTLYDGISKEQADLIENAELVGLSLEEEGVRIYPQKDLAAHLTGVIDDGMGLFGLEYFFDKLLTGRHESLWEGQKISGVQNIVLTLDIDIQKKLKETLARISQAGNVSNVTGYVVNVDTGSLLAGAQWPSFNPENFDNYPLSVSLNNFLQPIPIPKKFQLAISGACDVYSQYNNEGINIPWSVVASNKNLASEINMWKWMGLSDELKPDFAPSNRANRDAKNYQPLNPFAGPEIGAVKTRPVQLVMALSAVATGKAESKLHVIDKLIGDDGKEANLSYLNKAVDIFQTSSEASLEVRSMLGQLGKLGENHSFFIEDQQVVGLANSGPVKQEFVYSFLVTEKANIAMLLMVERNSNVLSKKNKGRSVIFEVEKALTEVSRLQQSADMFEEYFTNQKVEKDYIVNKGYVEETDFVDKAVRMAIMPNLVGYSFREALKILGETGCNIIASGSGFVISQEPVYGSPISDKDDCRFSLDTSENLGEKYVVN
ncbi:MAG: PASTA domain-containing protein [Desulfotalea sp.]